MAQEDDVILTFPSGIVGHPELKSFHLLEPSDAYPMKFLHSVEDPDILLVGVDVAALKPDYEAPLAVEVAELLQLEAPADALVIALVSTSGEPHRLNANLAGPLVANVKTRTAVQLVLDCSKYPLQHSVYVEQDETLLHFPGGLVGFPELRHFRLLEPTDSYPLKFMQSVEQEDYSFVCVDVGAIKPDYTVAFRPEDAEFLALKSPEEALILALVVVPANPQEMTANLAGPLVVNSRTRRGLQMVLNIDEYPLRHPILGGK